MNYFTNFISNIKFLFTNNLICTDNKHSRLDNLDNRLSDTFHTSIKNLSNINKQNERIDWTHTKMNNLSKSIKIYIENIENDIKENTKSIERLNIYENALEERTYNLENDIKDINGKALYQLRSEIYRIFGSTGFDMCANHYEGTIERIKGLENAILTLNKRIDFIHQKFDEINK